MDSYNLSYTLDIDQQKRLSGLVRRYRDINGWGVRELLQHAASANSKAEFELKLEFLEAEVVRLETEAQVTAGKEQVHISEEERAGCLKVMEAFRDFYSIDLMVLDAGRYGFVKVQDYHYPFGFDEADLYTTARDLFNALWDEWLASRLLALSKGTPLADLDYQDIYKSLPVETQREITEKRDHFLACSGISL
ncbi:MAG: hypothetical protein NC337_14510 [Roseburia sp.]|nr:hypothetical protein [Roseburia sp.]